VTRIILASQGKVTRAIHYEKCLIYLSRTSLLTSPAVILHPRESANTHSNLKTDTQFLGDPSGQQS